MEKAFTKAEELIDNVKQYVNNRFESAKLFTAEKSSAIIANLLAGAIIAFVLFFFLIFLGIALSFLIGEWLGATWLGFLIIAVFYLLIGIVIWLLRSSLIQMPIIRNIYKQIFNTENYD